MGWEYGAENPENVEFKNESVRAKGQKYGKARGRTGNAVAVRFRN
jgi:hypothetical protein